MSTEDAGNRQYLHLNGIYRRLLATVIVINIMPVLLYDDCKRGRIVLVGKGCVPKIMRGLNRLMLSYRPIG